MVIVSSLKLQMSVAGFTKRITFGGARNVYKITAENLNEILGTWINWSMNWRKGGGWKKS